jgi:ADP-ribosylglycohydrolase
MPDAILRGYGPRLLLWMLSPVGRPYGSLGNGFAMRVNEVAHACGSVPEVLDQARRSAECTHNHPAGIAGAQAVALAVFLARHQTRGDSATTWGGGSPTSDQRTA